MKIAIVSDTHDRAARVGEAVAEIKARRVRAVVHCGDVTGPEVVALFAGLELHLVLGNCDDDPVGLRHAAEAIGATLHEGFGYLELAGKKLAFTHGHDAHLRDLRGSRAFDYVFHGHTHVAVDFADGPTRVINPGALHRVAAATFVVLDLVTGEAETVAVR